MAENVIGRTARAVIRHVSVYPGRYGRALKEPFAFLAGQVLTFFAISLYVKLVQMRLTSEYGSAWLTSGRFGRNCLHYLLFCGQEICLLGVLLAALTLWQRSGFAARTGSRCAAWIVGVLVLPLLSLIAVLGLAHFALFLTPLGPEQLRVISWARHIVSASNALHSPGVIPGLVLALVSYYLTPAALWVPQLRSCPPLGPAALAAVLLAGLLTAVVPKPLVADAVLAPHPLIWLLLGDRSQSIWQASVGLAAIPDAPQGRVRFSIKTHPTNVVIFVLESTRFDSVALFNDAAPAGRELRRFSEEAVLFDQIYAPVPTSAHALFSILYGVYPHLGAFWSNPDKSVVAESIAQVFARAGYATHLYITGDLNFDNIRSFAAPGFARVLDTNDWPGQEAYASLPWGPDDRLLIDETKRFIASMQDRPFFLVAMTSNPHHPYAIEQLPGASPAPDERTAYERLVDYDLRLLLDLYRWMKEKGVAERTLLLVLGDHGEAFGEHPGNFGHAAFIYEENVHIPCFILHPRRLGLPRRIAQLGSQVDLRATILDMVGRQDSEPGDGMSLLKEDAERIVFNFTEEGITHFGLRDSHFTYIYTPHTQSEQLFDRRRDLRETRTIAPLEPAITNAYGTRLRYWESQHQLALARILR